jgi:hypothetical protein
VVEDFAALCKAFYITKVTGDHYAGEFPRELFRKHGIGYELSKPTKSELFRDLLPLLNSRKVMLPRNDRLVHQIVSLERRVAAAGRETITAPDRGHDDLANAVAGAAKLSRYGGYDSSGAWLDNMHRAFGLPTVSSARSDDGQARTGHVNLGIPMITFP